MQNWRFLAITMLFLCTYFFGFTYTTQAKSEINISDKTSSIPTTCDDFISSHDGTDQHKKDIADAYLGALTIKGMFLAKEAKQQDQNLMIVDENTPIIIKSEAINVCRGQPNAILSDVVFTLFENYIKGPYYR